jgi:hypothetical protein
MVRETSPNIAKTALPDADLAVERTHLPWFRVFGEVSWTIAACPSTVRAVAKVVTALASTGG